MLQNILIGIAGWMVLAAIGGLCIGSAVRQCAQWNALAAPVSSRTSPKKKR